MEATLTVIEGGSPDQQFPLGKRTLLGRSKDADIAVTGDGVSRLHAVILEDQYGYLLEDIQSSNGTFVNGRPVDRVRLHDGDEIRIVAHVFRFRGPAEGGPISSAEVSLVQDSNFSTQVMRSAIADVTELKEIIEVGETALRRRLQVFFEIASEVAGTFEIDELLSKTLEAMFNVFAQASRGVIMLIAPGTGELVPRAVKKRHVGEERRIAVSMTVINKTIQERQAVLCQDAFFDERFQTSTSIVMHRVRSLMCAPLIAKDELVGAVYIDTTSGEAPFCEDDLNVLTGIAAQVAMAIRNTQLYEEKVRGERLAMVGQTIAGLAHCLKNVLNGIRAGSYVVDLGMSKPDESAVQRGWDIVKRNNAFMDELVLDMLAYAKERQPKYELADINEIVHDACRLVEARAEECGVALTLELKEGLGPVAVDSTGIRRCVLNLVTNAVDACGEEGGHVVVGTALDEGEGEVHITISDDGCGISEENRAKLFQIFFSTKGAKGTGLGLAVTHKIIREHKGDIDAASEEGKGTTFTIRLPRRAEVPDDTTRVSQDPSDTSTQDAIPSQDE